MTRRRTRLQLVGEKIRNLECSDLTAVRGGGPGVATEINGGCPANTVQAMAVV
jgi:hypothetical protein